MMRGKDGPGRSCPAVARRASVGRGPRGAGRRRAASWLLAVVGLAIVVSGCGVPTESSPRGIDPSSVPYDLLAPATGPTLPTTPPTPEHAAPQVYFVRSEAALEGVSRDIKLTSPGQTLRSAIANLTSGPTSAERQAGLSSAIPPGLQPTVTSVVGGLATIELVGEQVPSGDQSILTVAQLVLTATSVPGVGSVALTRGGQTIEAPLVGGALTERPLVTADYMSLVHKPGH